MPAFVPVVPLLCFMVDGGGGGGEGRGGGLEGGREGGLAGWGGGVLIRH